MDAGCIYFQQWLDTNIKLNALYQINKTVMKMLVRKNPEIIKSISMTITNRQADNNKCKETLLSTSEQNAATKPTADKLVSRIYDFFKL